MKTIRGNFHYYRKLHYFTREKESELTGINAKQTGFYECAERHRNGPAGS